MLGSSLSEVPLYIPGIDEERRHVIHVFRQVKVNGGNSGHVGNSGQRQFLQRIGRR